MKTLLQKGLLAVAVIAPALLSAQTIEEMTNHITGKILDEFGIECSGFQRWCE